MRYIGHPLAGRESSAGECSARLSSRGAVPPRGSDTTEEHFVYKLGPAMRPPRDLKAGGNGDTIKQSARVWCAIDTLLTGQFDHLGQARDETKKRLREAETG